MHFRRRLFACFILGLASTVACVASTVSCGEEKKKEDSKESELDPTEYLPGPAGIPIKVPFAMERQLKKYRATQAKTLKGGRNTYFVIGLLETTYAPRDTSVGDVGRAIAVVLDFIMLPISIPAGEPGFLTNNMGPPPPNWIRSDAASVQTVKGKKDALELVYGFTTQRVLDPPDPQVLYRQRQWFLLTRTNKESEASTVAKAAIKSIEKKNPNARKNRDAARLVEGLKPLPDLAESFDDPEVKEHREAIEDLLGDIEKFKPEEAAEKLRKLNDELRVLFDRE